MNFDWIKDAVNRIMGHSRRYKRIFLYDDVKDDGGYVLCDLAVFCGAKEMPVTHDAIAQARLIGRLDVYQYIIKQLNLSPADENRLTQQMMINYQQQKEGAIL